MTRHHEIERLPLPLYPETSQYNNPDFDEKVIDFCAEECKSESVLRVAKCIAVGDIAVGKTCVINRFGFGVFSNNYKATIGVDFDVQKFHILGLPFNLQIWDTAGQERFRCITSTYYRGANVALIVFDVNNIATLQSAKKWHQEILDTNSHSVPTIFLVGNKKDLLSSSSTEFVHREAIKMAKQLDAEYWCVSAATGENIDQLFDRVASLTFNQMMSREIAVSQTKSTNPLIQRANSLFTDKKYNNNFIKLSTTKSKKIKGNELATNNGYQQPRSCITINCVIK